MTVKRATFIAIGNCANPHCRSVHITLIDEDDQPFAEALVPDSEQGREIMKSLKNAFYFLAAGGE